MTRPVVRSFPAPAEAEAAAHVKAGGHAILWESPRKALLVIAPPDPDDLTDLNLWAVLDLSLDAYWIVLTGGLEGLAIASVPRKSLHAVRHRIARDSIHPGPRHPIELDCLACGACCRANRVVLNDDDKARFDDAGRSDLYRRPYARRDERKRLVLIGSRNGDCKHLGRGNLCGIYPIRPDACRYFPPGSECCLSARREVLALVDGSDTAI